MSHSINQPAKPLEQFGDYLRLVAQLELDPRLRGRLDPADAVQQTLAKALQKWDQFRGETEKELLAWLRTILSHYLTDTALEFIRHGEDLQRSLEQTSVQLAMWMAVEQSSPSKRAIRKEEWDRLSAALRRLPEDQRIALELRHLHSCSVPEICERMGRSTAAVAGLLRRGLKRLRNLLDHSQ